MAITVTMSSAGTSNAIQLDWVGAKTTTVGARFSSSTATAAFQIQCTLDDPMRSSSPTWFFLSTAASATYTSSTNFDTPAVVSVLTPIAGVRLISTGLSSGTISIQALQNAGG